ncbi:hypothetical protein PPYR_13576 [Photinus pyralis]|uniref:Spaetzle domain-containing protein n=1 Tax=Photinus pyralis TaxID=7054 RepID=A0A1Y1K927_PHOPY|nr:protein spaetzle-like [Photinus pyralis]KAB0793956.1 hypothetical protein PPYR_13576 [Photinus pyralis]
MADLMLVVFLLLNVILVTKSWPGRWPATKRETQQNTTSTTTDDGIVFPDVYSTMDRYLPPAEADFSASGKGQNCVAGVCNEAKDYPYNHIKDVLNKIKTYNKLFGFLEGTVVTLPNRFKPGVDEEDETLCPVITHTVYPKTIKNENDTERYIINIDEHKQGLVFETCVEKAKCKFYNIFPAIYTSQCSQRYARRRLVALEEDGKPATDTFVVPSCCVCTVKIKKTK